MAVRVVHIEGGAVEERSAAVDALAAEGGGDVQARKGRERESEIPMINPLTIRNSY